MDRAFKFATYILLIFAFVAVLAHAAGFSTGVNSIFGGLSSLGRTIIGASK